MFIARFVGSLVDNVSILLLPYDTLMLIFRVEEYLNFGKEKTLSIRHQAKTKQLMFLKAPIKWML